MSETRIMHEIMLALSKAGCLVLRQNVGVARTLDGRYMRYGVPGTADIIALAPGGRFLAIEVKTATGRQSKEQVAFEAAVKKRGGIYVVARSADEAIDALPAIG